MDEGNPSATKTTLIVARGCSTARLGNTFALFRRPRVQHGSLGQHFRTSSSPEGAARHAWATLSYIFVAQGCSTALLGNTFALFRRPRVQHGTLGQHFRTFSSPEGAARHAWATPPRVSVSRWCSTTRLGNTFAHLRRPRVQHGSLGQHFRTSSSPEGAARHAWATLSHFFVARGYSTARLSDTFVLLRRPRVQHDTLGQHFRTFSSPEGAARHAWATPPRVSAARRYWAKDVRLNLTKKEEVSQKRGRLQ